jgi:hydrogenase maturation factor
MCLTIPKQVLAINKDFIEVISSKGKEKLGTLITIKKGDWILSQNGVIISKITASQAKKIDSLLSS